MKFSETARLENDIMGGTLLLRLLYSDRNNQGTPLTAVPHAWVLGCDGRGEHLSNGFLCKRLQTLACARSRSVLRLRIRCPLS